MIIFFTISDNNNNTKPPDLILYAYHVTFDTAMEELAQI